MERMAFASFCLYGDDLDPGFWTGLLGREPTFSARKGEVRSSGRGRVVQRTGAWILSTEDEVVADDLDTHIRHLVEVLGLPRRDVVEELGRRNATARVFCYWFTQDGSRTARVSPEVAAIVRESGAALEIDEYR